MKTGYLGPPGTFTEIAALSYSNESDIVPYDSIEEVIYAVNNNEILSAVVPIENSTEGTVNTTLDMLIFDVDLYITGEIKIPVNHFLLVKEEFKDCNIEKVISHPQALAQCRNYLHKKYPAIIKKSASSTTSAAEMVAEASKPCAAIGTMKCAEIYGLYILDENIQDEKKNETKFVVISKEQKENRFEASSYCKANYKTSIAFSLLDKPGELYKALSIFNLWDLNMSKIVSRPMRQAFGEYVFFIDIDGHIDNPDLSDAVTMVKRKTVFFKILGSYSILGKDEVDINGLTGATRN